MARIDYFNDPNAPQANSVVPSVTAVVTDPDGRILMVHKTDNDLWALPGGGMDLGESITDAAIRETKEEIRYRHRSHRPDRRLHQPPPRPGLRRRRGPPTVLPLLHHPHARRHPTHLQRDDLTWLKLVRPSPHLVGD
ncbi:NUDIX domain-containing protein [Protofrankia symbiont of Coriaria ruscifolia]|uniref:NUDIX hydrolase n=1 Tax=Protofrankia symbiont of Coriaria ruscifolia TaxID=1306542 RepID=UPI001040F956